MIKVVWFVNIVLPQASRGLGLPCFNKGGWLEAYIAALTMSGGVALTIVCRTRLVAKRVEVVVDQVRYVLLPSVKEEHIRPPVKGAVKEYCEVVEEESADLIHYHGSEYHYGLLTSEGHIRTPAVISIQGLLTECMKVYYGGLSFKEILQSHTSLEIFSGGGVWRGKRDFRRRAKVENSILSGLSHVIGRTFWDHAHVLQINPKARYYHCDEVLRPAFYESNRSSLNIKKFSIYVSTASYPIKGFHFIIKALAILRQEFPDVLLRVADRQNIGPDSANGYFRFLYKLVTRYGVEDNIEWLGQQDEFGVVNNLANSHVFVCASTIENSSNAIAEAMIIGVPSVASYIGGNPTMLSDEGTGLLFPNGDYVMLAACVRRLFLDDRLAQHLGDSAREVALRRHDYALVGKRLTDIYKSVLSGVPC